MPEGRSSGPASTPESPPPPPRTASPTPEGLGQPRAKPPEDCCVCYETLVAPMVHLCTCPHRLHLPCYAALRIRAATDLRCPACRATAPVGHAGRRALQQHSEELMAEAMAIARQEMPAEAGGGSCTEVTRDRRGGRENMHHLPRFGEDGLRAHLMLLRGAPPSRPWLRGRRNPPSQGQRGAHGHVPGHVPESGSS